MHIANELNSQFVGVSISRGEKGRRKQHYKDQKHRLIKNRSINDIILVNSH